MFGRILKILGFFLIFLLLTGGTLYTVPSVYGLTPSAGEYLSVHVVGYGDVSVVVGGSSPVTVPPNSTLPFKITPGTQVTIEAVPLGNYIFTNMSGSFSNSTSGVATFTVNGSGMEIVYFAPSSVVIHQSASAMVRFLMDIVLAVGTFIVIMIGILVAAEFMAGSDKDKAWDELKVWLIGVFLFYGALVIGPSVWVWLRLP